MSQLDKSNNLDLVKEISLNIEESKQQLAITVNATLSLLYWQIGKRINEGILQNQRAEYGKGNCCFSSSGIVTGVWEGLEPKTPAPLSKHCGDFSLL
jgi:hypothetical protein